jgi:hypothetical protein
MFVKEIGEVQNFPFFTEEFSQLRNFAGLNPISKYLSLENIS